MYNPKIMAKVRNPNTMRLFAVNEAAINLRFLADVDDFEGAEMYQNGAEMTQGEVAYVYAGGDAWFLYDEEGDEG